MIYVTFRVPFFFQEDEKFAVKCGTEDEARAVAMDANSMDGVKNIRFRKCGKPRGRRILTYNQYFDYLNWY